MNASAKIRREEFPGLQFDVWSRSIHVYRDFGSQKKENGSARFKLVVVMTFPTEKDLLQFVASAFPYCTLENVTIYCSTADKHVFDAIVKVADSVMISGVLQLSGKAIGDKSMNLVRKFRRVKVSFCLIVLLHAIS